LHQESGPIQAWFVSTVYGALKLALQPVQRVLLHPGVKGFKRVKVHNHDPLSEESKFIFDLPDHCLVVVEEEADLQAALSLTGQGITQRVDHAVQKV
jgi:hypothetical protein